MAVVLDQISTSALIFAPSLHVVQRVHPASFELFSSKAIYLYVAHFHSVMHPFPYRAIVHLVPNHLL